MGDIIHSGRHLPIPLQKKFRTLVDTCNDTLGQDLLSPYQITLGDEFQGLATSLPAMVRSILCFEETQLELEASYRIRLVGLQGHIATEINTEKPYGMLGPGLKDARELLATRKRRGPRISLKLEDKWAEEQLNRLFVALDGIISRWPRRSSKLILDMICDTNNERVGVKHEKNRSQIYKLRKSKMIAEYRAIRDCIEAIASQAGT